MNAKILREIANPIIQAKKDADYVKDSKKLNTYWNELEPILLKGAQRGYTTYKLSTDRLPNNIETTRRFFEDLGFNFYICSTVEGNTFSINW